MGLLDKMLGAMKYDDEDEYEDDYYDDDYDDKSSSRLVNKRAVKSQMLDDDEDDAKAKAPARSTPRNGRSRMMSNGMEVCVVKPTSVEDAREITETLLNNRTVVLNLEGIDVELAQRIIDFTSGSCFAINGNLQKISRYIFIVTPASVDISGDFQEILSGSFEVPPIHN